MTRYYKLACIQISITAVVIGSCGVATLFAQVEPFGEGKDRTQSTTTGLSICDEGSAIARAEKILGHAIRDGASAKRVSNVDSSVICDQLVSGESPIWVVRTPKIRFCLVESNKDTGQEGVYTKPLFFDVLVRAIDGAVLRIQSDSFRIAGNNIKAGEVRNLPAASYLRRMRQDCGQRVHKTVVEPRSTFQQALASTYSSVGGPENADQIVAFVVNWSEECRGGLPARDAWIVEARSTPGAHSVLGSFEAKALKPDPVSVLVSVVIDGTNEWIVSGNFPKPMVVGDDGKILFEGDLHSADHMELDAKKEEKK